MKKALGCFWIVVFSAILVVLAAWIVFSNDFFAERLVGNQWGEFEGALLEKFNDFPSFVKATDFSTLHGLAGVFCIMTGLMTVLFVKERRGLERATLPRSGDDRIVRATNYAWAAGAITIVLGLITMGQLFSHPELKPFYGVVTRVLGSTAILAAAVRFFPLEERRFSALSKVVGVVVGFYVFKAIAVGAIYIFAVMQFSNSIDDTIDLEIGRKGVRSMGFVESGPNEVDVPMEEKARDLNFKIIESLEAQLSPPRLIGILFLQEPVPTSGWLTFSALKEIYFDHLHDERSSEPLKTKKLTYEERKNLIEKLKKNEAKFFVELDGKVEDAYRVVSLGMTFVIALMGNPYFIYVVMLVLFVHAIVLFREKHKSLDEAKKSGFLEKISLARSAIPQLGLVGTVLGLSQAMQSLAFKDDVQVILKQPGVSPSLAFSLGMAFNTTLIGLLLSMSLNAAFAYYSGDGKGCGSDEVKSSADRRRIIEELKGRD